VAIPLKIKQLSALALPLTKVLQRAYIWLGGEMVFLSNETFLQF
jgi:hypothetical protein